MSHHKLREDKTCLNCGRTVDDRYCTHCGQENIETHQTFGGLVAHFIEDLTHYEGKFWRSLKYLLFRPGYLSKVYLEGKRVIYIPPVRLYIFISFVTFLLPHFLPEYQKEHTAYTPAQQATIDSIMNDSFDHITWTNDLGFFYSTKYKTMASLDSTRAALKGTSGELSIFEYLNAKKSIELRKYTPAELFTVFSESLSRSFPKSLFVYMPFFALVLWVFHGKKRWMYFDHAILTLHYFSFILLSFNVFSLASSFTDWMQWRGLISMEMNEAIFGIASFLILAAWIYYFYRAHLKLYEESRMVSFLKASAILFININSFVFIMFFTFLLTLLTLH